MPSSAVAMLCSVLRLSRRLLRPLNHGFPCSLNHSLPSFPLSSRHRCLSSPPTPGAAGWTTYTYEPLADRLGASVSETPTDTDSDTWTVFDPISGRIVVRTPLHSSSTAEAEEKEEEGEGAGESADEEKARVKGKGEGKARARARGEEDRARRSSAATVRNPSRKGNKGRVSYVCKCCGEGSSQWWGICRHCQATRSLVKQVLPAASHSLPTAEAEDADEKEEGAGELQDQGKGTWKGRRARRSSCVSYMCSICGEGSPRWWGTCRHCQATRSLVKRLLPAVSYSSPTAGGEEVDEEEGEGAGELQDEGKGKWKGHQARRSSCVSYVCTICGESSSQWWGKCRHCNAAGALARDCEP